MFCESLSAFKCLKYFKLPKSNYMEPLLRSTCDICKMLESSNLQTYFKMHKNLKMEFGKREKHPSSLLGSSPAPSPLSSLGAAQLQPTL
jgi:hypothetical protein